VAGFLQIIELTTSRIDEMRALNDEWRETHPDMGPQRILVCADRDRPNTYLSIVEFESYEVAMRNNEDPQTEVFATRMAALCDGPPSFRNLDLVQEEIRPDIRQRQTSNA
jgi:hypothetical protein